ncbi:MAG: GNAT family N-acetyltransferase [Terriglobales bacterium]|jgi:GNAT superfamily N-acetyltransferase
MQFVDRALARRFESAEEMPQVHHAHADQKMRPHIGSVVEPIAGGHMIFAGLGSPIGRAVGMGFDRPVTEANFEQLENFYFSRKAPSQLDYCPLTDISLLEIARKRGYGIVELNNVLARKLDPIETFPPAPAGFTIRPGKCEEALVFSAIVRQSFFPDGGEPAGFDEMLAPLFAFPGAITFVAEANEAEGGSPENEKLVAVGAGLIIPKHKIVALFGAGTLKPYRGRGLQTAILQRRLEVATKAGCEYAVIVTQGGTTSMRNAERLGFSLAYSKATLIKDPPPV